MSIITLQYGQCGNQVAQQLYSNLYEDINSDASKTLDTWYNLQAMNKWFNVTESGKWEPRAVLVDTETKVVENYKHKAYNFKHKITKSTGGSANNWAFGYSQKSKLLQTEVLDAVRTEVEKCDFLTSILNIFSSSGGTGSGVGTRIIELMRDLYPNKPLVNVVILPYFNGEVVTQNYNTICALAKLYPVADSMVLFENDNLHYICTNILNIKNVTIPSLNNIIAQQLSSIYQPVKGTPNIDFLMDLTAHPSYKFLHLKSAPHISKEHLKYEAARNWKSLWDSLAKQNRFEFQRQVTTKVKLKPKTLSDVTISRGLEKPLELESKRFADSTSYVNWIPKSERFRHFHEPRTFDNIDKYLTIVSNSNSVYLPLNSIVEDAWNLFTYDAYLHHYEKYDVDKEFFLETFQIMENILHQYKTL